VVIADADAEARARLRAALESAGIGVAAGARTGVEAVRLVQRLKPDALLVDLRVPELDGVEVTRQVLAAEPGAKVVVLSDRGDDDAGIAALRAGAVGYLAKGLDDRALPRVVRGVCDGEAALSREMTLRVVERLRRTGAPTGLRPVRSVLTAREWEVLDLLCEGATTAQLADQLVLSTETVRSHVKAILRKLGVSSRAQAVVAARRLREQAVDEYAA
jgi:DNA-binding NarL/FixJ family response regulator